MLFTIAFVIAFGGVLLIGYGFWFFWNLSTQFGSPN